MSYVLCAWCLELFHVVSVSWFRRSAFSIFFSRSSCPVWGLCFPMSRRPAALCKAGFEISDEMVDICGHREPWWTGFFSAGCLDWYFQLVLRTGIVQWPQPSAIKQFGFWWAWLVISVVCWDSTAELSLSWTSSWFQMRVCNPIFPQAAQRHDSEKLGTNSVDVKSCESPEVSPGRRLQGRRPTPPGSQATRSKRFANACAAADKQRIARHFCLGWVLIAIDSSILAFFWECLDLGVAWLYNCYHTKEFSWPDSQCSPACKLASLKHYQQKPLSGDAPLMWREFKIF